jgi:hypothetical protein
MKTRMVDIYVVLNSSLYNVHNASPLHVSFNGLCNVQNDSPLYKSYRNLYDDQKDHSSKATYIITTIVALHVARIMTTIIVLCMARKVKDSDLCPRPLQRQCKGVYQRALHWLDRGLDR